MATEPWKIHPVGVLEWYQKNGFPDRFPSDCYDVYGHYDFGGDEEWHSTGVTILPTQTMHC